ncbi:unnamed protein product [Cylicocyclus nassatus]|uniref:Beta-lactamase-related domain-containing protein n=1 Tax=Cylicocyclus nassatus TaxID=53992 RepID=A0AA36H275_CYLNA|nr:unnamed protein product [Cylicocyclus nassatus]
MGLLRYAAFLGVSALLIRYGMDMLYTKHPIYVDGEVDSKFDGVRKAFEQNFKDGWEAEGASLAVFVKGRKVVDLWGGYADVQAARKWRKDTMSVVFSTTKAVAALCIALLADRGRLKYGDLVSKHWPGFAKNGKGNITIEWVMSHMAGLHYFDTPVTEEMARDHNLMREIIENEVPKIPPGTASGYHTYTYGWLVDQIIRHTDEKKRGVGQFLREEITQPNGIDFHIGLNLSEEYRMARVTPLPVMEVIREIIRNPSVGIIIYNIMTANKNSPFARSIANPSWADIVSKCTVNNPEHHTLEQAAAFGIGNARSLATIFSLFVNGRIVSEKTLKLLEKPVINETDYATQAPMVKGHGFFYRPPIDGKLPIIGHDGHGCQQLTIDLERKAVIAYVTNGLKMGMYDTCRTYRRFPPNIRTFGATIWHCCLW